MVNFIIMCLFHLYSLTSHPCSVSHAPTLRVIPAWALAFLLAELTGGLWFDKYSVSAPDVWGFGGAASNDRITSDQLLTAVSFICRDSGNVPTLTQLTNLSIMKACSEPVISAPYFRVLKMNLYSSWCFGSSPKLLLPLSCPTKILRGGGGGGTNATLLRVSVGQEEGWRGGRAIAEDSEKGEYLAKKWIG